ncbi:MAG: 16S rRNA (uracil(1498)-N(3))-methyltransferase [Gallionellaceae bacterium]|jgi:16S rRNA (uracil1498-N3)-methyltransferase|nr:16S rRNA (uracil(1498)-N(3))-methyltransferase [Gallionellaceae bacterium]
MSAPRFYCPPPLPRGNHFELPREAAHHAHRVLRLRENDAVQVFDGEGGAFDARIAEIGGRRVVLHELQSCMEETESPLRITLAQAMCGSEKMDWVMQKATELGAAEIVPVQTQRSVAKLTADRAVKRTAHWRSVAIAACEQCGRNVLPLIHPPQDFAFWLANLRAQTDGARFILQPEGATALHKQSPPQGSVILLIGPEGGFSEDEMKMAHLADFIPVRLGKRVMRTETAAMAGIVALQTLWGDFS